MDLTWHTFGHEGVKKLLGRQLLSEKFPHAYLFTGPEGIGKKTLALEFAGKILGTGKPENHPDFKMLDEAGQAAAETVRDFIASLGLRPFFGRYKVAIINDAHKLNLQSGNALLKTLEEPSDSTIIILIALGRQMLPTVVSRCQVLNFNLFSPEKLKEYAGQAGLAVDEKMLLSSFGQINRLRHLAGSPEFASRQAKLMERFNRLKKEGVGERLAAVAELADTEGQELEEMLSLWAFYQKADMGKDAVKNGRVLAAIYETLAQLRTNKNRKLVLQGLFLKL